MGQVIIITCRIDTLSRVRIRSVLRWSENVVILTKFSSLAAQKVVKMTTCSAANDENFVKMATFSFQCTCIRLGTSFNINIPPNQYLKSCIEVKTIVRFSSLHNGISCISKSVSLRWGGRFNINTLSNQYLKYHFEDKTAVRFSFLHSGISCTRKSVSLYWNYPKIWRLLSKQYHFVKVCCHVSDWPLPPTSVSRSSIFHAGLISANSFIASSFRFLESRTMSK